MGQVYRAIDVSSGRSVAVKVLRASQREHGDRFAREVRLLAELQHPHVVSFVATGATAEGHAFLAMEWLDGETLAKRLARGALPALDATRLVARIATAVEIAHARGIVHRDLKPANLFLVQGDLARVKVLDFGIARLLAPTERLTVTGEMLGTPGYMSPEQARGTEVDARCDVFALGCVLFRAIAGATPWTGDPLAVLLKLLMDPAPKLGTVAPNVPLALEELVDRMLSKLPEHRPRDAGAVRVELENILAGAPAPSAHSGAPTHTQASMLAPTGCMLLTRVIRGPSANATPSKIEGSEQRDAQLLAIVRQHGGTLVHLVDGTCAIQFYAGDSLPSRVAVAARCALALLDAVPDMLIALSTERHRQGTVSSAMGIDDNVRRLEHARANVVTIDSVAAEVLGPPFVVRSTMGGFELVGARGGGLETSRPGASGGSKPLVAIPLLHAEPPAPTVRVPRFVASRSARVLALLIVSAIVVGGVLVTLFVISRPEKVGKRRAPRTVAASGPSESGTAVAGVGSAPSLPPASPQNNLDVPDIHHVDAVAYLPKAQARVVAIDPTAQLVGMTVVFSSADGTTNVAGSDEFALYVFEGSDHETRLMLAMGAALIDSRPPAGPRRDVISQPCALRDALAHLSPVAFRVIASVGFSSGDQRRLGGDSWMISRSDPWGEKWGGRFDAHSCAPPGATSRAPLGLNPVSNPRGGGIFDTPR